MPALYQKLGIRFQYPDNWVLDEKDALAGENSVTVYSPGGAFWSVVVHPSHIQPEGLLEAALKAMQQEYSDLDYEPVREAIAGHELTGYDLNFYCLDLTNTALLRALCTPQSTYLLISQADDAEFKRVGPVFQAMTASFLTASDFQGVSGFQSASELPGGKGIRPGRPPRSPE